MKSKIYTDQQIISAVKNNSSVRTALKELGIVPAGGSYKTFYANVKRLGLDISHFTGQAHLKGKKNLFIQKQELSKILVKESAYTNSTKLKLRLINESILIDECSKCFITEWMGEKLSLHLDHIDGDNTNNEINNLRLLCPNCHSQTPTYCGRNKGSATRGTRTPTPIMDS